MRQQSIELAAQHEDVVVKAYDYDTSTTYRARLLPFDAIRREQKMNMSIFRRSRVDIGLIRLSMSLV